MGDISALRTLREKVGDRLGGLLDNLATERHTPQNATLKAELIKRDRDILAILTLLDALIHEARE